MLDVNTDCCTCTFKNKNIPFELDEVGNIEGYYHDKEEQVYEYRLEENSERFTCQMLPKLKRTQQSDHKYIEWDTTEDNLYDSVINIKSLKGAILEVR